MDGVWSLLSVYQVFLQPTKIWYLHSWINASKYASIVCVYGALLNVHKVFS